MSLAAESDWTRLSKVRTHEQVIAEIEGRLESGSLRAGDRLPPERQLAEALGVSRNAVREAMRVLEAIGIVEAGTGSGPSSGSTIVRDSIGGLATVLRLHLQVASFSTDDLLEIRLLIERLAARKAADAASLDDIAGLRALVDQMRDVDVIAEYNDLDTRFHAQIAEISGNALASVLMAAMRQALRQAMVSAFERLDDPRATMRKLTNEHAAIVDVIASGDGDRASQAIADHICGFYRTAGLTEAGLFE